MAGQELIRVTRARALARKLYNHCWADMRLLASFCFLIAALATGCDPAGLRRVEVRLPGAATGNPTSASVAPEMQGALAIIDTVAKAQGFQLVNDSPESAGSSLIREYVLKLGPVEPGGFQHPEVVPIRVWGTASGLEVWFGEFGFLAIQEEAGRAYVAVRSALRKQFGAKNVKSHIFGKPNKPAAGNAALRLRLSNEGRWRGVPEPGCWAADSPLPCPLSKVA